MPIFWRQGEEQEFKASLIHETLCKDEEEKEKNLSPDRRGVKEKNEKQRQNISKADVSGKSAL